MVHIASSLSLFISFLSLAATVPLEKRIAQTISDATQDWVKACTAAATKANKDNSLCGSQSQKSFMTLLAAGNNCDQQDAGDDMINLAKEFGNDSEMIRLTQLFVQQPRNTPDLLQVPYCQRAPKNKELNGLFHCQFEGSKAAFSGDQTGNVPLGLDKVDPVGSCLANPAGFVPAAQQLEKITQDPGVPIGGLSAGGQNPSPTTTKKTKTKSKSTGTSANGSSTGNLAKATGTPAVKDLKSDTPDDTNTCTGTDADA